MKTALLCLLAALGTSAESVTIVTAENVSISAREVTLSSEGGGLTVRYVDTGGQVGSLKASDVVEIVMASGRPAPAKPAADDVEIELTTGDFLAGKLGAPADDGVRLLSPAFADPLVKFGRIRALRFPANRTFLPARPPEKADAADLVLTRAGDRAEGTVLSISSAGVVYKSRRLDKEVTLPLDQAAGVWLVETEEPPREPKTLFAVVLASDGSSLRGEILAFADGILDLKDLYGSLHKIPADRVSGITLKNGRVVYLSDLAPTVVDEDANFIRGPRKLPSDLDYPFQRDRSAKGTKIILGGLEHRKGLGVRARSSLTYDLGGSYKRFQSTVGLDAASNGLGAVLAEVYVDGAKVKDATLKGQAPPQPIDLDVAGARELRLVVTWAGIGQSDFAGWGSARLIR